jgi:hypothetical protein
MFIMSLAAADITVGGIVMPISSVYAITGKKRNKWIFQTSDFQICYGSHKDGRINHFNASEAFRLIFSGITDNVSYIVCSLCRLIRRPEHPIGRHWPFPAN